MDKSNQVYLDYAATTPVDPLVVKAMSNYYNQKSGNTASLHSFGREVKKELELAREAFARQINAQPKEVVFTSSATESNNLALKGLAWAQDKKKHLIISAVEHDCVLHASDWLKKQGFKLTVIDVDKDGQVNPKQIEQAITEDTFLVSIMHANNEVGTFQPIEKVGQICKKNNVLLHTDAAQTFAKYKIDVKKMNIDLLTASSHKIYGPKGAALLYIKKGIDLEPLLHGGGHEMGLRSSTVNVGAIVGFKKAMEIAVDQRKPEQLRLSSLKEYLAEKILNEIPDSQINGSLENSVDHIINFSFSYVEGESLVLDLDQKGIAVSTGSACSSPKLEPSHVLIAMGVPVELAHGSLRVSLGRQTTQKDINYFVKVLKEAVIRLRKVSPFTRK